MGASVSRMPGSTSDLPNGSAQAQWEFESFLEGMKLDGYTSAIRARLQSVGGIVSPRDLLQFCEHDDGVGMKRLEKRRLQGALEAIGGAVNWVH